MEMVFLQWILFSGEVKKILEVKHFFTCRGPGLMMGNRGGIQQGNMRNRGGEIGVWRQGQSGGSNLGGFGNEGILGEERSVCALDTVGIEDSGPD